MNSKVLYLFLSLSLFLSAHTFAQMDRSIGQGQYKRGKATGKPADFVQQTVDYYTKELKLDDFQAAAVREIIEAEKDNLLALNQKTDATLNERKDRAKAIYDRIDAKILPLLNTEQNTKYKKIRKIEEDEIGSE